jgi:hypothetical protein
MPTGLPAASVTLPWLAVGVAAALAALLDEVGARRLLGRDVRHAESAALVFLAVAPAFLVADRLGVHPFGIDPLIVRLTAIHFVFAGFALPLVGAAAWRRRSVPSLELALGAVVVGIPLTAFGFLGFPTINWIGALLVAAGGFGVGSATLSTAGHLGQPIGRRLMRIAGGSLLLAMPLAAVYATGLFLGLAWLDIPAMVRIHGMLNVLGFALPSFTALALEIRWADAAGVARTIGVVR